ncbi:hypothetical protein PoB_003528200 [Plakobranchus ocellatus]|uniref:Uncharacterized protein n=1 Tax=Plakobranchus ocellatus TaxID=259542 RepID=A0AAV4APB3_9GAST|nr:hypothetical protein PoB_003528200 [Plakobranchus ocellatus]
MGVQEYRRSSSISISINKGRSSTSRGRNNRRSNSNSSSINKGKGKLWHNGQQVHPEICRYWVPDSSLSQPPLTPFLKRA